MPESRASYKLTLLTATGEAWRGLTQIRIENDRDQVIFDREASYRGPVLFEGLRTVPRGLHMFHVKTELHVPVSVYFTVWSDASKNDHSRRLMIHYKEADPYGEFINFLAYGELAGAGLTEVANRFSLEGNEIKFKSNDFHVREGPGPEYFDGLVTDAPTHHRRVACLLNLYTKLRATKVDENGDMTALDFVGDVFCIEQDRLFARVPADVATNMKSHLNRLGAKESFFESHGSWMHTVEHPDGFEKYQDTFKSKDSFGNLQLAFSSRGGAEEEWIVDVDIDEKSGLAHVFEEGLYHRISGARTNPYAVHQLLCMQGLTPPYSLVTEPPTS